MGVGKVFREFAAFMLEGKYPVGTCFFANHQGENYLVTAKHVVEDWEKLRRKVYVRLNRKGPGVIRMLVSKKWIPHPDPAVDLAAIPFRPTDEDYEASAVGIACDAANEKNCRMAGLGWPVQETEEVIFPAMMHQTVADGDNRNLPVIRFGHIALGTEIVMGQYGLSEHILIESQIYPGNSGAPVWVLYSSRYTLDKASLSARQEIGLARNQSSWPTQAMLFLGVISSSHPELQEVIERTESGKRKKVGYYNLGISLVVPAVKVIELLECKELERMSKKEEPSRGPIKSVPVRRPPEEGITKKEFEKALKNS